ncbi:hypothetical protein EVAR_89688_1 [Eumeta japonica]|uniref:Uncharacterized protein n=1 Tax=Eumeta variegata TaxID=151549 RepID=A0A4C1X0I7_EUMVA|nr:hypothetical protein EVAR_89688_1 [Eumeta japonica]
MSDFSSHLTATDPAPFARRAARRTVTYHSIARSSDAAKDNLDQGTGPRFPLRRRRCELGLGGSGAGASAGPRGLAGAPPNVAADVFALSRAASSRRLHTHKFTSCGRQYLEIARALAGAPAKGATSDSRKLFR